MQSLSLVVGVASRGAEDRCLLLVGLVPQQHRRLVERTRRGRVLRQHVGDGRLAELELTSHGRRTLAVVDQVGASPVPELVWVGNCIVSGQRVVQGAAFYLTEESLAVHLLLVVGE